MLLPFLSIAAYLYSASKQIPWSAALQILPAFLLEAALYAACGVEVFRNALERWPKYNAAALTSLSALVPYLLCTLPSGTFSVQAFGVLTALVCVSAFWFAVFPKRSLTDAVYLLVLAGPILGKVFPSLYPDPAPKLQVFILGVVMWYRTALISILAIRGLKGVGFGFFPRPREWWIGLRCFLLFLPIGLFLAYSLDFLQLRDRPVTWDVGVLMLATFFGVLWVLAVAEEFFFRGYLQQLLTGALGSEKLGLVIASAIFGAAHLGFRNQFPNWRFVILATVAGFFYGLAFQQARSIRAGMVTHAFVVTVWRIFLI